jgi:hypothetical protein
MATQYLSQNKNRSCDKIRTSTYASEHKRMPVRNLMILKKKFGTHKNYKGFRLIQ